MLAHAAVLAPAADAHALQGVGLALAAALVWWGDRDEAMRQVMVAASVAHEDVGREGRGRIPSAFEGGPGAGDLWSGTISKVTVGLYSLIHFGIGRRKSSGMPGKIKRWALREAEM